MRAGRSGAATLRLLRRMPSLLRIPVLFVLVIVGVGCSLAASGCGGKSEEDVQALLDRAFDQPIESADVKLDAELAVKGLQGLDGPVRLEASGVYIARAETIPELDIDLKLGLGEGGQSVESGFLSTGDRAFLKFGGEFYEQPPKDVARANRELSAGGGGDGEDAGVDPRSWVVEGTSEGEDDVAGVATEHVSAKLDTGAVFADLNELVERSGEAIGGVAPGTPQPLTEEQLSEIEQVVDDPTFDVYVGEDDEVIRRLSATVAVTVPEEDRERVNGIEGGTLRISIEFSDVNGDQSVEAPADSRPIEDLGTQLGGLGGLGGGETPAPAPVPEPTEPGAETPGAEPPSADVLKRYTDCLDQAEPDDTAALQRCNMLLPNQP